MGTCYLAAALMTSFRITRFEMKGDKTSFEVTRIRIRVKIILGDKVLILFTSNIVNQNNLEHYSLKNYFDLCQQKIISFDPSHFEACTQHLFIYATNI